MTLLTKAQQENEKLFSSVRETNIDSRHITVEVHDGGKDYENYAQAPARRSYLGRQCGFCK